MRAERPSAADIFQRLGRLRSQCEQNTRLEQEMVGWARQVAKEFEEAIACLQYRPKAIKTATGRIYEFGNNSELMCNGVRIATSTQRSSAYNFAFDAAAIVTAMLKWAEKTYNQDQGAIEKLRRLAKGKGASERDEAGGRVDT